MRGELLPHLRARFNKRQSRARVAIECAFGKLKGRFRCLTRELENTLDTIIDIGECCIVLHNLCTTNNDPIEDEEWQRYWRREQGIRHRDMEEYWASLDGLRQYRDERDWVAVAAEQGLIVEFHALDGNGTRDAVAQWFMNDMVDIGKLLCIWFFYVDLTIPLDVDEAELPDPEESEGEREDSSDSESEEDEV